MGERIFSIEESSITSYGPTLMSFQKIFPVLTSIAIIIVVAILRDRSRAVAAVLATMPINIPLALWIVSSGSDNDPQVMSDFVRSLI